MAELFLKLLDMSFSASWLILAVVLLRLVLKSAPKSVRCILWGLVALRLLCPISVESALSLIPKTESIPQDVQKVLTFPAPAASERGITDSSATEAYQPLETESFLYRTDGGEITEKSIIIVKNAINGTSENIH